MNGEKRNNQKIYELLKHCDMEVFARAQRIQQLGRRLKCTDDQGMLKKDPERTGVQNQKDR